MNVGQSPWVDYEDQRRMQWQGQDSAGGIAFRFLVVIQFVASGLLRVAAIIRQPFAGGNPKPRVFLGLCLAPLEY